MSADYNPTDETARVANRWPYTVHTLKTEQPFYRHILWGQKTFEVRRDDRGFQPGDLLVLAEWDGSFTGQDIAREITYVLRDAEDYGVQEGFVVLGLAPMSGRGPAANDRSHAHG